MNASAAGGLRLEGLTKSYGAAIGVADLTLDIPAGEMVAILGPSGSGKTTLMRLIAGLEQADGGRILLDGLDIGRIPAHRRPVNMMFQSYALFPHLNVAGNIAYGLVREGRPRAVIAERVAEMVRLVQLGGLEARKPDQLSGGQRQRVALARALARAPKLLLLDEPMAALDRKLRDETRAELVRLQRRLRTTFVLVTHDQDEALSMADRVAVLREGRVEQCDTPSGLYERPASRFIAEFVGAVTLFDGVVEAVTDAGLRVVTAHGRLVCRPGPDHAPGAPVCVAVRPERFSLATEGSPDDMTSPGVVEDVGYAGPTVAYRVRLAAGGAARISVPAGGRALTVGERVVLRCPRGHAIVLPR